MVWETLRYPRKETSELIWIYSVAMMAFSALTAVLGLFLMERFQMTEANIGPIITPPLVAAESHPSALARSSGGTESPT